MKGSVETIGRHERKVSIEVPQDQVEHELAHVFQDLRRSAKIPGFRPGKAPESVLLKVYGDYIQSHAKEHLVGETLPEFLEKEFLVPVSEPVIEAPALERGSIFKYTARFEVRPTVEVKNYKGMELKKEPVQVAEEAVGGQLEQLRQSNATLRPLPEGHEADLGDTLLCHYHGTLGEEEVRSNPQQDSALELGAKGNLPGLDEKLKGVKAGEERHVGLELPKDFANEALAGKKAQLHFHIKALRRKEVPALDDDFAKDLGEESLAALRGKVRKDLEKSAEHMAKDKLREEAAHKLVEANPLDVPPSMIESESRRIVGQTQQQLAMQGLKVNAQAFEAGDLRKDLRKRAVEAAQRDLLLEAVAVQEKIEVPDGDLDTRLQEIAKATRQPFDKLKALYEQRGWTESLREKLRQERALDFILEKANMR